MHNSEKLPQAGSHSADFSEGFDTRTVSPGLAPVYDFQEFYTPTDGARCWLKTKRDRASPSTRTALGSTTVA